MPFLDELGKRMTNTVDLTRLQYNVGEEERIRQELYRSIGEQYVALHKEDPEEALAGLVSEVKASFERTEELRRQIRTVKGLVQCPKCGADVDPNVMFCMHCGSPIPRPEPPKVTGKFCVQCGAALTEGAKFCFKCGHPVPQEVVQAAPAEPQPAEAPAAEVPVQEAPPAEE